MSRIVVPEFSHCSGDRDGDHASTPAEKTCSPAIVTPSDRSTLAVAAMSRPGPNPTISDVPLAIAAKIRARCDNDLSPGTLHTARKLPGGASTV